MTQLKIIVMLSTVLLAALCIHLSAGDLEYALSVAAMERNLDKIKELLNLDVARGEEKRARSEGYAVRSPLNLIGFWLMQGLNLS
jgi:hypothetical protein